ncbi:MAG: phage late control D family protein [Polyangiaceae bacterium]
MQYNESDLNFISRILEQEGIYYFFKHEKGKHTLVLADSPSSHEKIKGYEDDPVLPAASTKSGASVTTSTLGLRPSRFALVRTPPRDFNFTAPKPMHVSAGAPERARACSL